MTIINNFKREKKNRFRFAGIAIWEPLHIVHVPSLKSEEFFICLFLILYQYQNLRKQINREAGVHKQYIGRRQDMGSLRAYDTIFSRCIRNTKLSTELL